MVISREVRVRFIKKKREERGDEENFVQSNLGVLNYELVVHY